MVMGSERLLAVCGTLLLAVTSLLGFVQHRYRAQAEAFARWRVVHAGGTAGAVQLLALAGVWKYFPVGEFGAGLALALVVATCAFVVGPLARALDWPRTARVVLALGAAIALPAYLALPVAVLR